MSWPIWLSEHCKQGQLTVSQKAALYITMEKIAQLVFSLNNLSSNSGSHIQIIFKV